MVGMGMRVGFCMAMGVSATSMIVSSMTMVVMAKRCHADEIHRQTETAHNEEFG